jgi:type IV fimbrial biogenesis protein FimT
MTAVAILGIIFGIAVPSLQSFVLNQRVRNASFELTSDLLYARSEATKRNTNVSIAAINGYWHNGWTISVGGDTLKQRASINDLAIVATGTDITFRHTGRLPIGSVEQRFDLHVTNSSFSTTPRCLIVNTSGKVSAEC